ncbi:alpha/beta-hydrolase [Aspergillus steynii IBT 23096]|uniref:Alpha/beta-hydrolase n=1 Tax=Aspergillus steynii IBT 23096 TaxID=1392250 RepID=A0A2I2GMC8_9EURO|nr:alpha/beta-hydrolase [Aspergillus steynii IBT 23096]PLB54024.1 alpha/beta-hydrolase [Aspergillus steynii IBT 23096]
MTIAPKPTIVFSIGSWLTPASFDTLRAKLLERLIPTEAPAHPSVGAEPPTKTLTDDISSLKSVLTRLVEESKDVIVVGHSSGGISASGAVEGLLKTDREAAGKKGGVVMIVFMAAFVLDKGQSLLDMLGGKYLPWMDVQGNYVRCSAGAEAAFHDLTPEEQQKWSAALLHTSRELFSGAATYEPWHQIPSAYIITEEDHALPAQYQEIMAGKLATQFMYRLKSSHSPFLSIPDRLAEVLQELARTTVSKIQFLFHLG